MSEITKHERDQIKSLVITGRRVRTAAEGEVLLKDGCLLAELGCWAEAAAAFGESARLFEGLAGWQGSAAFARKLERDAQEKAGE